MAVRHEHTVRLSVPTSHVQLACNGVYVGLPHSRANVGVWSLQDLTCKPLELEGHRKPVTGLSFGQKHHPTLLCSAAEDYVIVWNIERARKALDTGQQVRGKVVGTTLGVIQHVTFSVDDQLLAVCAERQVYILDSKVERINSVLEGHTSGVNCAAFCPHHDSTLVTASDDRTFKVWDISNGVLLYQSTIISSSPFISLTMNPQQESFALGTGDGQVRIYDLTEGNGFRCLHHLDVARLANKVKDAKESHSHATVEEQKGPVKISSRPSWQQQQQQPGAANHGSSTANTDAVFGGEDEDAEVGCAVLSMLYTQVQRERAATPARLSFLQADHSLVSDLLDAAATFVIGTTGAVIQVNAKTLEPMAFTSLQEPMSSNSLLEGASKVLSLAGNIVLAQHPDVVDKVWCVIGSYFQNEVSLTQVWPPSQEEALALKMELSVTRKALSSLSSPTKDTTREPTLPGASSSAGDAIIDSEDSPISVLSSAPLVANSPLKAELVMKNKETPQKKQNTKYSASPHKPGTLVGKKGNIVDNQSLTFHPKVTSSGYTEAPRRTMFQPNTNVSRSGRSTSSLTSTKHVIKEYPVNSEAPTKLQVKLDVAERPTSINCVRFSEDGQHLACALGNTSAQVFRMPLTGKGCAFAGHGGIVSSIQWSHDNKWLVTASEDKSACVWSLGLSDPVMTFNTTNNNFSVDKVAAGSTADKENAAFGKPVRFAQFYYMDKYILLTCGNAFHLYKYHLDTTKSDIKRYLTNNRYKLVKSFQLDQQITAFSAINSFHSYIALCSGSDKSVEVFDLNVGQSIRVIPEVHTRAVHCICQNEGSQYVSHPGSAYDLFVTAAASDSIKLWDLRSNRCVRRYEGHCNRTQPCGLAISPCCKYIATGSEDRSAYIFDIRSGTYLHKLTGHTDTVSDVAFHPLYPQVLTATLDGKVRLFT